MATGRGGVDRAGRANMPEVPTCRFRRHQRAIITRIPDPETGAPKPVAFSARFFLTPEAITSRPRYLFQGDCGSDATAGARQSFGAKRARPRTARNCCPVRSEIRAIRAVVAQKFDASSVITGAEPVSIRARCMAVAGNCRGNLSQGRQRASIAGSSRNDRSALAKEK